MKGQEAAQVDALGLLRDQAWSLYARGAEVAQVAVALKRPLDEVAGWIALHADTPEALRDERHLESLRVQLRSLHVALASTPIARRKSLTASIGRIEKQVYDIERRRKPVTPVAPADAAAAVVGEPFTVPHFVAWSGDLITDSGEVVQWEPFQLAFVADLFAGRKENWLVIPEGNGKTTLIGALILYHCEHRAQAWVPVAASSRDQAEILYQQAAGFVLNTPRLEKLFECFDGYRRIDCRRNRSRIKVFAADAKTGDGVIPTMAVIEELHRHKDLSLYRTWMGKMRKRKGAQLVTISTAGEPYSDFEETREKMRQMPGAVRVGTFIRAATEQAVIHDYAILPTGDVTNVVDVKAANPFSGVTIEGLQADYDSPTMELAHYARFKANKPTRSSRAAVNDIEWTRALVEGRIPKGAPVEVGFDVAWKWDTTAIVPLWVKTVDVKLDAGVRCGRCDKIGPHTELDPSYRLLGPATIIEPPRDGTSTRPETVHAALLAIHAVNPITTVVMDITAAEETAAWIVDNIPGCIVIEWPQSNEAAANEYERFMTGLRSGWLHHTGDRGLTRHVMNAVRRVLANGKTRFDRPSSSRQGGDQAARVVDALTAACMVNAHVAEALGEEQEPMIGWA